ncbi:unnamed protein product [Ectocarpus sp. 12 AP-2014]
MEEGPRGSRVPPLLQRLLLLLTISVGVMVVQQCWGWSAAAGSRSREPLKQQEGSEHAKLGVTDTHAFVREAGGETHVMSGANLFQSAGCPQALSRSQAEAALDGGNKTSNTITLLSHGSGRSGNHFLTISSYLAMGFCCRSRLLTLPEVDTAMPGDDEGGGFKAGERWFDFSRVTPPWPGFEQLGDNPEVCRPQMEDGADNAFGYEHVHSRLLRCMNRVYLRGCEKAYLGKMVDLEGFCPKQEPGRRKGAGSLVVHIRSGDIFNPDEEGRRRARFGQPPLQYYLHVFGEKDWDNVTFLTAAWNQKAINPTFSILEVMAKAGTLGDNVRLFKNRPLLEDVREMLCADALATSRSSMSFLTFAHSRATTFFVPTPCGNGGFRRMRRPPVKATFDNTTLLLLEKPDAEVYGTAWPGNSPKYSVYQAWHDTPEQLLEMATFGGIEGVQKCSVHPPWHE